MATAGALLAGHLERGGMSGFSTTPNFSLKKPITGADDDMWGTHWNQNADALDSLIQTVQNAVPVASTTAPGMDGAAAVGTGTTWARADHIHPTDTSRYAASNPSGYQTAAQVQAATRALNYADNSGFSVNQRSYVSGTALAAAAYGHDRWKAGAGGCTYTFPAPVGPSNTITITAGTLQQVVEGGSIVGGNYMLSWTGTAQGRVGAGSYAASPVAVAGIVAGANTTIEFNGGSLGQVKFESGTVATPWFANGARYELSNCQRFYRTGLILWGGYVTATCPYYAATSIGAMRALPTIASLSDTSTTFGARTLAASGEAAYVTASATATGGGTLNVSFSASADL